MKDFFNGPWFIGDDYNENLKQIEKSGVNLINYSRANKFLNCINYYDLIDQYFKGSHYT